MADEKSTFELHLEKLKAEYKAQLPAKLEAITSAWTALCHQWQGDTMVVFHRNVHSLIGTSGTFGFTDISKSARALETALKPLLEERDASYIPSDELRRAITNAMDKLSKLIAAETNAEMKIAQPSVATNYAALDKQLTQTQQSGLVSQDTLIYYLDQEIESPELLQQNLFSYGFKSQPFKDIATLTFAITQKQPSLVVMNLTAPNSEPNAYFDSAKSLIEKGIKVFVLAGKEDFKTRLLSVRAGIHAYVSKPGDIPSLIGLIRSHLNLNINKPTHILIVDDQISVAEFYGAILEKVGMKVTIETNPLNVLALLQNNMPDLLLLDLHMPDVNGDELAAVIRQQESFQSLPILFLSANAYPYKKADLLEIGTDDLLTKDMPPEDLVRHVHSRVERSKTLTAMMYQDSLTGLLNHAQIQLAAERVFQQYRRNKMTFTIAIIDIDNFKSVNDSHGHLSGDRVIKALAQLFQQRLRTTDYIGRFGGEEFLMVMPDMNIHDAGNLINSLRKSFSLINFKNGTTSFNVSFSAGVAENTGMDDFMEQIKYADEALYKAKERGRNIVCASLAGDTND